MFNRNEIAKYYAGCSFFPVTPNTKVPYDKYFSYKKYSLTDIKEHDNIGILTGTEIFRNRFLVVLDVDFNMTSDKSEKVVEFLSDICNDTVIVKTGGLHDGLHVYYLTNVPAASGLVSTPYGNIEIKGISDKGRPEPIMLPPSVVLKKYTVIHPYNGDYIDFCKVKQLTFKDFITKIRKIKQNLKTL